MQTNYGNLPLNLATLQTFAEDGDGGASSAPADNSQDTGATQETGQQPSSDFKAPQSQSELDSILNKSNQKALDNYKKGEAERMQQAIAEALKKEKDYANLSAQERAAKEFDDQRQAFESERQAFEHEKLVVQVGKDLVSKGLPIEMAELFASQGDAEQALKSVSGFQEVFDKAVAERVAQSLRQATPQASGTGISSQDNYGARLAGKSIKPGGKII